LRLLNCKTQEDARCGTWMWMPHIHVWGAAGAGAGACRACF
jgi:hypothetical protein